MSSNPYFTANNTPSLGAVGSSSDIQAQFLALVAAFNLLPSFGGNGRKVVRVNVAESSLEAVYRVVESTTVTPLSRADSVDMCTKLSAGVTINANVFQKDDQIMLYNDTAAAITLTQGAGLTLRLHGTATTGNRTLAPRGRCEVWFLSGTECVAFGPDVT